MASKYSKYERPKPQNKPGDHPIWRGIGCLLMIILPVISYFSAQELIKFGASRGWYLPPDLMGYLQFPDWVWKVNLLAGLARPFTTIPNFLAVSIMTLLILFILSGIFSFLYSLLYRVVGPPTLSPLDAPPIKNRKVRRSR